MPKPTVAVELTESELRAIFERMDRHPTLRGKVAEASKRLAPIRRAARREEHKKKLRWKEYSNG